MSLGVLDDEAPASVADRATGASPLPPLPYADGTYPGGRPEAAVPFDPMGTATVSALEEISPSEPTTRARIEAMKRRQRLINKFKTLEAMYAEHPALQTLGRLRVERLEPKFFPDATGQRVPVSGIIDYSCPPIGTAEFMNRFGGLRFQVFGTLEQTASDFDGGAPQPVDVAVAEFTIPLPPNMNSLPIPEASIMSWGNSPPFVGGAGWGWGSRGNAGGGMPAGSYPGAYPSWPSTGSLDSAFSFASDVINRASHMSPQPNVPPQAWEAFSNMHAGSQSAISQMAQTQAQILQSQLDEERRRAAEERQWALQQMQASTNRPSEFREAVEAMAALTAAQRGSADSDTVRQMRDEHERTLRFQREESDRRLADKDREMQRNIQFVQDEARRQVEAMEARVRYMEDTMRRREQEFRDELLNREQRAEQYLNMRLSEKEQDYARRINELQASHQREMSILEAMKHSEHATKETMHASEMRSVERDLAKLSAELEEKAERLRAHEEKANRPLLDQIAELNSLTEQIKEMTGGGERDDDDEELTARGESKWYESPLALTIAKGVIEHGKELLPKLNQAIAAGGGAAQAASAPPAPPMVGAPAGAVTRPATGLPPPRRYRMVFEDEARVGTVRTPVRAPKYPKGVQSAGTESYASGPAPFDLPDEDPFAPPRQPAPAQRPAQRQPAPPPRAARPVQAPPPPQSVPASPPQAPSPPPANAGEETPDLSAFSRFNVDLAVIQAALVQLETLLVQGNTPESVVQMLAAAYPVEQVASIPLMLPIADFVETIRSCPATAGLMLGTGRGKRFLYAVWSGLEKLGQEPGREASAEASAEQTQSAPEGEQVSILDAENSQ